MIVVAILLAATFTRLLDATYSNIARGGDVIVSAWLINRLISALFIFWGYRGFIISDQEITFAGFVVLLVPITFLFLQSQALSATVIDPRTKLGENFPVRKRYFALFAAMTALGNALATVVWNIPTSLAGLLINVAIFISVYFASSRITHIGLVSAHYAVLAIAIVPPLVRTL